MGSWLESHTIVWTLSRSHVHVEGPHEKVQVPHIGRVEELWHLHERQGDAQGSPDVAGHDLVALVFPLLVQSSQEVAHCLPERPSE